MICLLGLNPHNAEFAKNSEEKKTIIPVIKFLRKKGIKIEGPASGDTVFINKYKRYDIIVGMFHDQVLIPFKTLFSAFRSVSDAIIPPSYFLGSWISKFDVAKLK